MRREKLKTEARRGPLWIFLLLKSRILKHECDMREEIIIIKAKYAGLRP